MKIFGIAATGVLLALLSGAVNGDVPPEQPPIAYSLQQNTPDPFCTEPAGSVTVIQFATPQTANIVLCVWSPDGTTLVKTLVNGTLQAGYFSVVWDGRNDLGDPAGNGAYPYRLTAREPGTGALLYEATLVATVSCHVPSGATTWGLLKTLFREAAR